jgi:hypothetical protein
VHHDYRTRDQARASVFDYLEVFYNRLERPLFGPDIVALNKD